MHECLSSLQGPLPAWLEPERTHPYPASQPAFFPSRKQNHRDKNRSHSPSKMSLSPPPARGLPVEGWLSHWVLAQLLWCTCCQSSPVPKLRIQLDHTAGAYWHEAEPGSCMYVVFKDNVKVWLGKISFSRPAFLLLGPN